MDVQSVRDMELERCDSMMAGLWEKINKGDPYAVIAAIKVMERRSRLLGLDAPTKQEFIGALMTVTPQDVARMSDTEVKDRITALLNRVNISHVPVTDGKQPEDDNPEN